MTNYPNGGGCSVKLRTRPQVFGRLLALVVGLVLVGLLFAYGFGTELDRFAR